MYDPASGFDKNLTLAGATIFVCQLVVNPVIALWIVTLFSAMYYFSRTPCGSTRDDQSSEWIDDLSDQYLP